MDYPRCTNCRNPIKAHQERVAHPQTGLLFHADCWATALRAREQDFLRLQEDYLCRIEAEGLAGLLSPYVCRLDDAFVPEQRVDSEGVLASPADVLEQPEAVLEQPEAEPAAV